MGRTLVGAPRRDPGADLGTQGMALSLPALPRVAAFRVRAVEMWAPAAAAIRAHAETEYPKECCGLVLKRNIPLIEATDHEGAPEWRLLPGKNVAPDPTKHYSVDIETCDLATELCDAERYWLWGIYHSHVGGPLIMSRGDRDDAAPGGVPTFPQAIYMIATLIERPIGDGGFWVGLTGSAWDAGTKDFEPLALRLL